MASPWYPPAESNSGRNRFQCCSHTHLSDWEPDSWRVPVRVEEARSGQSELDRKSERKMDLSSSEILNKGGKEETGGRSYKENESKP